MHIASRCVVFILQGILVLGTTAAFAQTALETGGKLRIGMLMGGSAITSRRYVDTFSDALRPFGLETGRNVVIEPRYASGEMGRLPALAKELVDQNVNVIIAGNEPALIAAKNTNTLIPIVVVACDPLEKLVGSLARPGGNATGITCVSYDLVGKRLGYLKTLIPNVKRIAFLYGATDDIDSELRSAEPAARTLGVTLIRFPVRSADDFSAAFDSMTRQDCQALYVSVSAFTNFHRQRFADLALVKRLPSINGFPEFPEAGGLISYGATLSDGFTRAAYFADRILKGASPRDLPVEEPTRFYLFVNAKTAKTLGVKIPGEILIQASKVIE